MPSYNKVIIVGHLTRDVQIKFTPNNTAVGEFGIACNHKFTTAGGEKREEVTFVDCTAWGKSAETLAQYVQKGSPLLIEGRLKLSSWEDKTTGQKRSNLSVVVESFQFLGGRADGYQGATNRPPGRPQQQRPVQDHPFTQEDVFKSDDIPF